MPQGEIVLKIAIAGCGMAGSYLYRLLKDGGLKDVDVYGVLHPNRCGSRPCAWGFTPSSEYRSLLSTMVDPERYVLQRMDRVKFDGLDIGADIFTVDKPSLINDLVKGAEVHYGPLPIDKYDRIVDATGVDRAYLPPVEGADLIADCVQYRVRSVEQLGMWFRTSEIGYEWCFPVGGDEYHIGFGNLKGKVTDYRPSITNGPIEDLKIRCKCFSKVRMSSPHDSQPFTSIGKVVGVGESIGMVGPLGSDGNIYAMQGAKLLYDNWDDLDAYSAAILKKYDWMRKERVVLDKLNDGKMPSIIDAHTFLKHTKRIGMELDVVKAIRLFKKMLE